MVCVLLTRNRDFSVDATELDIVYFLAVLVNVLKWKDLLLLTKFKISKF